MAPGAAPNLRLPCFVRMRWSIFRGAQGKVRPVGEFMSAKPVVDRLEIHVTHACNLTCESCSHYSNHGHKGQIDPEEAERWFAAWSGRVAVGHFILLGGEPTVHPRLAAFVPLVRKHWPEARIAIITNGFFLDRHPELPLELAAAGNCEVSLSVHHDSPEYRKRIEPALDLIRRWRSDHGIAYEVTQSHARWTRRYVGFGDGMEPFEDGDPRASWQIWRRRRPRGVSAPGGRKRLLDVLRSPQRICLAESDAAASCVARRRRKLAFCDILHSVSVRRLRRRRIQSRGAASRSGLAPWPVSLASPSLRFPVTSRTRGTGGRGRSSATKITPSIAISSAGIAARRPWKFGRRCVLTPDLHQSQRPSGRSLATAPCGARFARGRPYPPSWPRIAPPHWTNFAPPSTRGISRTETSDRRHRMDRFRALR
jgi:hypothetical protein